MILVSKFMVHRAFSDKAYLSLGLLSPLSKSSKYLEVELKASIISARLLSDRDNKRSTISAHWNTDNVSI